MFKHSRGNLHKRRSAGAKTALSVAPATCFLAALLVVSLAAGCSAGAISVNGSEIPGGDFHREVSRRLDLIKGKNPEELKGERGARLTKETKRQVATEMIKAELVRQQARELGVFESSAKEAERRLNEERAKLGEDGFERRLAEQELDEAGYLGRLEEQVLVEELGKAVSAELSVTEDEAESYYLTHKELYSASAMVRLAHILVDTEGQALMVAGQVARGEDFARLAQSVSQDAATRNSGGEMGWVEKGTMEPAFEQAAFGLDTGQVSGVVKGTDGFHVIKVLERRDSYVLPFASARDRVMADLLNLRKKEKFSDWLRTVYANAKVLLDAGTGRWDPALGMVVSGR